MTGRLPTRLPDSKQEENRETPATAGRVAFTGLSPPRSYVHEAVETMTHQLKKSWPFARLYWPAIYESERWAQLKKPDKAVLHCLLLRANGEYVAWPSIPELERATGYDRRAIERAIGRLVAGGHIRLEQRRGARNRYYVDVWKPESIKANNVKYGTQNTVVHKRQSTVFSDQKTSQVRYPGVRASVLQV